MDSSDLQMNKWAAQKIGVHVNEIKSVYVDMRRGYGGGCDTCGYGADEDSIEVTVYLKNPQMSFKTFDYDDPHTLIREMVAA